MSEGIIKFKIREWIKTQSLNNNLWENIERSRKKLFELKLIGFDKKINFGYGNISTRLENNTFVITGTQTGNLSTLDGNHFCIIKNVDFENNSVVCMGPVKPSSESITHAACYYSNHNINSVIHIHSMNIWSSLIKNDFPTTPIEAEYGSIELSESIKELCWSLTISRPRAIVMKGSEQGIIVVGDKLEDLTIYALELYNLYK